ncbi:MAG: DNA polymerase III subunit gamma/tau, partial [Paludibacteraceae bacterium]|nr:DNA polymerase III subunit gamma/tau [Paludibacteraceae bacterium]
PNGEPCNECDSCSAFNEQHSFNINELDAASNNSVEDIRSLTEQVRILPQVGKYSVFIIDEVHMLSQAAFNAFLKTLEEPPAHAIFILATTEKHKVIPTILSRCQIYDFNRIGINDIVEHLFFVANNENVVAEKQALSVIAEKADGGMRDALSIFDQIVSFCGTNITYDKVIESLNVLDYQYYFSLVENFYKGSVSQSLLIFDEILNKGFDMQHFITGLAQHLRNVIVSFDSQTTCLLEVTDEVAHRYVEQSRSCGIAFIYKALMLINECDLAFRTSRNKRLLIEITLIKLCQIQHPIVVEAEKKNEILPIKNEIQGQVEKKTETPLSQQRQQVIEKQEVAPINNVPTKTFKSTVSISTSVPKKTVEKQESSLVERDIVQKNDDYTEATFLNVWEDFAANAQERNASLSRTMFKSLPKKQGDVYVVSTVNQLQHKEILDNKQEILTFLRKKLSNDFVNFSVEISLEEDENRTFYTSEEKLSQMVKENSDFSKLCSLMDLELD